MHTIHIAKWNSAHVCFHSIAALVTILTHLEQKYKWCVPKVSLWSVSVYFDIDSGTTVVSQFNIDLFRRVFESNILFED